MSFRARLLLAFAVPIGMLLVNVAVVAFQQQAASRVSDVVYAREAVVQAVELVEDLRSELAGDLDASKADVREVYWSEIQNQVRTSIKQVRGLALRGVSSSAIESDWQAAATFWKNLAAEAHLSSGFLLDESLADLSNDLSVLNAELRGSIIDAADLEQTVRSLPIQLGLLLSLLASVIAVIFSIWFSRRVTQPIESLVAASSQIAEGNLEIQIHRTGLTEFDLLAESFECAGTQLRNMMDQIENSRVAVAVATSEIQSSIDQASRAARKQEDAVQQSATAVTAISGAAHSVAIDTQALSECAQSSSESVFQVNRGIVNIVTNATDLQSEIGGTSSALGELESRVQAVADSAEVLTNAAGRTDHSTESIRKTFSRVESIATEGAELASCVSDGAATGVNLMGSASAGMAAIERAFGAVDIAISSLNEKSDSISEIVQVIGAIADEAKLLALNASIISAQAGEHGLGFGVVARQLSTLAERSAQSVNEVSQLISQFRDLIAASVDAAKSGSSHVGEGTHLVGQAEQQLSKLAERARSSQALNEHILVAASESRAELDAVSLEAKRTLEVANELGHATKDQQETTLVIRQAMDNISELGQQVQRVTHAQRRQSDRITGMSDDVASRSRQIDDATAEQKAQVGRIEAIVELFDQLTADRMETLAFLSHAISSLVDKTDGLAQNVAKFSTPSVDSDHANAPTPIRLDRTGSR